MRRLSPSAGVAKRYPGIKLGSTAVESLACSFAGAAATAFLACYFGAAAGAVAFFFAVVSAALLVEDLEAGTVAFLAGVVLAFAAATGLLITFLAGAVLPTGIFFPFAPTANFFF